MAKTNWARALAALALLAASPAAAREREGKIALTFDDLPALTIEANQSYVDDLNRDLLRKLHENRVPAIGFVNESKIDDLQHEHQVDNLKHWLDAGMLLGNHTFSHSSPNTLGAAAYAADIERGERIIRPLMKAHGKKLRWFRHPYLETGSPRAVRDWINRWLADHGYRVAPVTIDAEDWEFAEPYDDAIAKHDVARQKRIRETYLAYTAMRIKWSQESAKVLFGRDIAHIMLLHCTRLNADTLDALLKLLRAARLRPVTIDEAMRDRAYRTRDTYAEKDGVTWLERWAATLGKTLPSEGDEDPPAEIQAQYDRVDNDRVSPPNK